MSYALRTTLILGGFWLLVFMAGVYQVHFRMSETEELLIAEERKIHEELEVNETMVASIGAIQAELAAIESEWASRSKIIPSEEASHTTYEYLDVIASKDRTTLNFDYLSKGVRDSLGVVYADYHISGEALFIDLYRFIWYIEQLPRYIQINTMELMEVSLDDANKSTDKRWVKFNIDISAISTQKAEFASLAESFNVEPIASSYDPFNRPRVKKAEIPGNRAGLVNVFSSTLRALTATQAYITDQKGELKILKLGDEVYLGTLIEINPDENKVIFDLDKLYPPRKVPLVIRTGK